MVSKLTKNKLSGKADGINKSTGIVHSDGWYNLFTGAGVQGLDKRKNTIIGKADIFDQGTLTDIFRADGLGHRIIMVPVKDMLREWFKVEGDTEGLILSKLSGLNLYTKLKESLAWARLFGGSIIVMIIDDGQELDQPVNTSSIRNVLDLQVYDRWDVTWSTGDLYSDERKQKFGTPEIYTVNNMSIGKNFRVHETRVLRFDGEAIPERARQENNGWGDSVIVGIYERLRGLGDGYIGVEAIITEFVVGVMTIDNLQALIATKDGAQLIRNRLQLLDMCRHILNTKLIDKNEKYDRVSVSGTQGLSTLIEGLEKVLAAVAGIPVIKLFPSQAQGLGGEAFGNIRLYYDDIAADQREKLWPELRKIIRYIMLSSDGKFGGKELDNWDVVFNPLWQPTEEEIAKTRKMIAETDQIYYEMGLPVEIIFTNRFGGDVYSSDTVLSDEYLNMISDIKPNTKTGEEDDDANL